MAILYIYPKIGDPTTYPLGANRVAIGRASTNDIVLSDQFSSGCHAVIVPTDRGYALIDQGSKNGTFRNGRRVTGEIDLARGDEVLVGSTRFYFDKDFQPAVETVEGTTFTHSSNTIIQVKDILKKPSATSVPLKTPGGGLDLNRFQQDQKMSAVIGEVSQALIYHMPLDRLLEHIMDVLIQHLPMDRGVLMLKNEHTQALEPKVVRVQNGALRTQSIFVSQTIVKTALERNSAILISDIQADEGLRDQLSVVQAQIHSAMCVPLWNNQDIIGLIYCDRVSLLEQFTEDDLRLLTLLANLAAVKIENARRRPGGAPVASTGQAAASPGPGGSGASKMGSDLLFNLFCVKSRSDPIFSSSARAAAAASAASSRSAASSSSSGLRRKVETSTILPSWKRTWASRKRLPMRKALRKSFLI